jgi:hypothetical protein
MTAPYEAMLDEAMATVRQRHAALTRLRADLTEVSSTATAPRRVVSLTLGARGEITALRFPTNAYKSMAPAELADVIMKTAGEARALAMARAAELLAPLLPSGLSAEAVLNGTAELCDLRPPKGENS